MLPDAIHQFVERVAKLPSIGPRQATRLAFYLMTSGKNEVRSLAQSIQNLERMKICERCFFVHENTGALCPICNNSSRIHSLIAIVEKETDLVSLERTGKFKGRYLVLGELQKTGALDTNQKLRIQSLTQWIKRDLGGKALEIILAVNPTVIGDINASLLSQELRPYAEKITRLGRGIPTGGEIEFADEDTLGSALERRI